MIHDSSDVTIIQNCLTKTLFRKEMSAYENKTLLSSLLPYS